MFNMRDLFLFVIFWWFLFDSCTIVKMYIQEVGLIKVISDVVVLIKKCILSASLAYASLLFVEEILLISFTSEFQIKYITTVVALYLFLSDWGR